MTRQLCSIMQTTSFVSLSRIASPVFVAFLGFNVGFSGAEFEAVTIDDSLTLTRAELDLLPIGQAEAIEAVANHLAEQERSAINASDLQDWRDWRAS